MGLTLVTPAASPPVTLAEARTACKRDDTADDTRIQQMLDAAIVRVEDEVGKALGSQTWLLGLREFSDEIVLERGPVIAIESFVYLDEDGIEQELAPEIYTLDLVSNPQVIVRNEGEAWPPLLDGRPNAVEITFTTGATASTREMPLLKGAVLGTVTAWYDAGFIGALPDAVAALLRPYRRMRI
jgi:uncharacterized phiE125 gp8 family phage protein